MTKQFASAGDLAEKKISFTEIGRDLWAFTAQGWAGVCAFGMFSATVAWGLSLRLDQ